MGNRRLIVPVSRAEAADADRFGPKAANLARLGHAGLPIPDGFCVDAEAYRAQLAAAGLEDHARRMTSPEPGEARRAALAMKLGLLDAPIERDVLEALLDAWRALVAASGAPTVVRSSALVEDRFGSSFAGQFESYLGLEGEDEFLTAVRSCWAALWSTRVLRYMATHDASPAETAMAVLVQPLVAARAAGGGLSRTAEGDMVLTATWGLGAAIAQGEVVPDRFVLSRSGALRTASAGRVSHSPACSHGSRRHAPRAAYRSALSTRRGCSSSARCCAGWRTSWACRWKSNGRSTTRGSSCFRRVPCTCSRRPHWAILRTKSGCAIRGSTVIPRASVGARAAPAW